MSPELSVSCLFVFLMEFDEMKRIVFLLCGLLVLVANTAEARRSRGGNNYYQPTYVAPATPVAPAAVAHSPAPAKLKVTPVSSSTTTTKVAATSAAKTVATNTFSTATAQGVANIMASRGYVGHFGGNPGYEGCGMAPTKEGAYNICCYANSGMATVDVGYAQGANGMWYCCRRYR